MRREPSPRAGMLRRRVWLGASLLGLSALGVGPLGATGLAHAQARVVLIAPDAELAQALVGALEPWSVSVRRVDGEDPGATMPGSAEAGRGLAEAEAAEAVVWLSSSAEGWAVWVYDAATGRAMARRLPRGPPFDEATAAALALSVMAMLRHSGAAPPQERVRPPEVLRPPRRLRLELAAGAEGWATEPDAVEPRVALAVGWWPDAWEGVAGVSLALRAGSGIEVDRLGLDARLFDGRVSLRGQVRGTLEGALLLGALVGVGVRVLAVDGSHASGRNVGDVRAAGVLELAGELGVDVDPVSIAARIGATATPWLQRYEVAGAPVLESHPLWPFVELAVEVGLR